MYSNLAIELYFVTRDLFKCGNAEKVVCRDSRVSIIAAALSLLRVYCFYQK